MNGNGIYIILALLAGIIPTFIWLWFWLREDKEHPEPWGLIVLTFIFGMASVIFVLPIEKLIKEFAPNDNMMIIGLATAEELIKYVAVAFIALRSRYADEPVDFPIYLITAALGFAALENVLFLTHPAVLGDATVSLLTGNLRFLGSTLLHATASGIIGIALGLSFYRGWIRKKIYLLVGIIGAISLHSIFNFFIMKGSGENFLKVFGFLWVVTIIIILLFEKLRRMGHGVKHLRRPL